MYNSTGNISMETSPLRFLGRKRRMGNGTPLRFRIKGRSFNKNTAVSEFSEYQ